MNSLFLVSVNTTKVVSHHAFTEGRPTPLLTGSALHLGGGGPLSPLEYPLICRGEHPGCGPQGHSTAHLTTALQPVPHSCQPCCCQESRALQQ